MSNKTGPARPARPMGPPGPGGPGPRMAMPGEKAKDFKGSFAKLMQYVGKYKIAIVIVIVFAVASTIFTIVGPALMGQATTLLYDGVMNMLKGEGTGIDFEAIGKILLTLIILYGLSSAFGYIQGFVMATISARVSYRMRKEISEKINRLPVSYFDRVSYGDVLSRVTNDVDTLSQTLNQSLSQAVTSVTMIIGVVIMMFTINVTLTFVVLCIVPVSLVLVFFVVKRSQKYFAQQQTFLGTVNGYVEEMYAGHDVIAAFNGQKKCIQTFEGENSSLYTSAWRANFMSGLMQPLMGLIGNLGYVAVCVIGGYLAATSVIAVGSILAFVQYVRSFTMPLTQLANISNILQQTAAASERVFEFLNEPDETPDTTHPAELESVKGNVGFSHVKFGYNPDKIIIKDFSADVRAGQKIAIVGPTGAGKTTLIKLLMRFYDPQFGMITVDGVNEKDFTRSGLRKFFGMVLQDTWLYSGTIMENIRFGRLSATDEEVVAAAKAAYADHFIRALPHGYQMELNEDATNISQGQKQLLTIARAILADPDILILDEATSSVDTRTEALIQKAMDALMSDRTSFVIAHRLSTIVNSDLILVMKDGDVIEQGTHKALLEKKGFYADLYNSQFTKKQA